MKKNEVLEMLNQAPVRGGARLSDKRIYTVHLTGNVDAITAPQARKLLSILISEDKDSWTEVELHDLIEEHKELTVKQTPWSIFKWYKKQLIEAGWITVE